MAEVTIDIFEGMYPHQMAVIKDPTRFKVLVWHRRARKTSTAIAEILKQSQFRVGPYWLLFPTRVEANDAVWRDPNMLFRVIPERMIAKKNEQDLVVYLKNGSYIQLKGTEDEDTLRGAGPMGVVFDEYEKMNPKAWGVVSPILRANGGWAWFIGTPLGKNHFYKTYIDGVEKLDNEWNSWLLRASTSGIIPLTELEKERRNHSEDLYNAEYECRFLEGQGAVFRGVADVLKASPQDAEDGHYYVVGADLARLRDFTVLSVYDRNTNTQVYQDRFQTIDWEFQKKKIAALSKMYNNAVVCIDSTGIGDPIANDLERTGVPILPYKITNSTKKDLIEKLSIWIQQKLVSMLPLEETRREFEEFTYRLSENGLVYYGAPEGVNFHDDIVISHALAVWLLSELSPQEPEKEPTLIQMALRRAIIESNGNDDFEGYF